MDVAIFPDTKKAEEWIKKLQKKVSQVKDGARTFADILSVSVFKDVISHFEKEEGSGGKWKKWSDAYQSHMEKIGRSGNQILQFSGRMRQSFTPSNFRQVSEGILWFNPAKTKSGFPYAYAHDEGGPQLPRRNFMYLSDKAMSDISKKTLQFILED